MAERLTVEQFKQVMPQNHKGNINTELMEKINDIISDPGMGEVFRENFMSYTHVMRDGKFKVTDYLSAVKYVSFKLMGMTNFESYIKTFPDRYQKFISEGVPSKDIHCYVSAYNKNKLVNLIYEQTLIPTHVLNADIFQKAINVQADLMLNAKSEKVKCDAANSLLNHLKKPESNKIELNLGVGETSVIAELRETTAKLAAQQQQLIKSNMYSAKEIAHAPLTIEGEVVDEDE